MRFLLWGNSKVPTLHTKCHLDKLLCVFVFLSADKKKASKFQPFKKFFGRRKKQDATVDHEDTKLKSSNSFGNVCNGTLSSDDETNHGLRSSNYSMGTRAFSHDSIFIPDGQAESEESIQAMSQDNILGKVKTLQQQLVKNIKFGQPPQMTVSAKATGEANTSLEADVLLSSPMETEVQKDSALPESHNKSGGVQDSLSPGSMRGTRHEVEEKKGPGALLLLLLIHPPTPDSRWHLDKLLSRLFEGPVKPSVVLHIPLLLASQYFVDQRERCTEDCDLQVDLDTTVPSVLTVGPFPVAPTKPSSRPKRHHSPSGTIETVNLDAIPLAITRLDNSAAKHKLSVKPKNQRVSKKHRRLSKELQSVSMIEVQHDILKSEKYEDQISKLDGHNDADKLIWQEADQEQKAEGKGKQDHWVHLGTEKTIETAETEVKSYMEYRGVQELEESPREQEGEKHKLQEEEQLFHMEDGKDKEKKKNHEEQKHQEFQVPKHKGLEEQRRREEREPEAQRQREEQREPEPDTQRQQAEPWHKEWEEQKQRELQNQKEENRQQKIEEKQKNEKLLQLVGKHKRQDQEQQKWLEEKQRQEALEEQRGQELKEPTHESEKQEELQKQALPVQKRQTAQTEKALEKIQNLEDEEKLQGKRRTMNLNERKRLEKQEQDVETGEMSKDELKEQELEKLIKSAEHGKCEPVQLKELWAEKSVQPEELIQQEEGQKLEEQKTPVVEEWPLEKLQEQDKSLLLQLDKSIDSGEKHVDTLGKESPLKEEAIQQKIKQPNKGQKEEEILRHSPRKTVETQDKERILGEELRWQEVDAGQTTPRGFTFQVSSGQKQIIFQKVNLSPVTPVNQVLAPSATQEMKSSVSSKGPHVLPTSSCVPHTAILVTGAQLCGTAVNLNQIKDAACKSLLGLTEERKMVDVAPPESTQKVSPSAKPSSSKMKHAQDPLGNQAILAEWASIRSKILKTAENNKLNEKDKGNLSRHSDDWTPKGRGTSHSNLRKTLSANAKFSITPAWQKFSEISKTNASAESKVGPEAESTVKQLDPSTVSTDQEAVHTEALSGTVNILGTPTGKPQVYHEVADNTEGCKFAKDLPSFLVPSVPHSLGKERSQSETSPALETQQNVAMRKQDRMSPNGEESMSPFGVKLRRTNYSLRFHYDQQTEQKKKKRYSAGDSFDGVPTPLVTPENEQDVNNIFLKVSKSPSQERKDITVTSAKTSSTNINQTHTATAPVSRPSSGHVPGSSQEKPVCKSPLPQKPALAPKPTSHTPPSSPLSKVRRSHLTEAMGQRVARPEPDASWRKTEAKGNSQATDESKNEEEETREKKSFFPSITMPWREKTEKKPEPLKKERPVLQSRHSIDGSKMMEKVETAQPLWITLALQKQKGFREQQATREERRQAREAKQAEKLAKENASINSQSDNRSSKTSGPLKPPVQEEKKVETAMSRLERREQLKKSNTLPTSVTVEISDSVSSSPLAKEVTKRFSTPDANPVSTEPAWLALAKRKAKAWSDCPQIIK
ncbi:Cancer-related regulator of actin dynamics [Varanus komodoensis]|nr:Cancer-related regulator of actin dynamics [Varanus komodoensis]